MPVTVQHCPLCNSPRSALFDQRIFRSALPGREASVTNRLCLDCGLVFQSPRMTDEELAAFYEQEYRQLYQGAPGPNVKDLTAQSGRADALVRFFNTVTERIDSPARIHSHLDIGCSAGLLLQGFQKAYGCQSTGVEPGTAYRQHAQAQGLAVFASLDELGVQLGSEAVGGQSPKVADQEAQNPTAGSQFDLISMAHVLEHLANPIGYLSDLREKWLRPEGWLLLEVPNLYCHESFEIAHLVSYSAHTLAQMLNRAGFSIAASRMHGEPRSKILQLYITVLARPTPGAGTVIRPEKWVKLKRAAGVTTRNLLTRLLPRQAWLPESVQSSG